MQIIESFLTSNENFLTKRTITPQGIMIHSAGVPQPDPEVFVRTWNVFRPHGRQVGTHAFLGADGRVFQTLPWNHRAWHCGGSANDTHIGIEMTEPNTISYTFGANFVDLDPDITMRHVQATYSSSVKLLAFLCQGFQLNPLVDGVIISHSEGHMRGIASNHGDVEHLWSRVGLTTHQFRRDIRAEMDGQTPSILFRVQLGAFHSRGNARMFLQTVRGMDLDAFVAQGSDDVWRVQLGAFTSRENADTLVVNLKKDGLEAFVVETRM